MWRCRSLCVNAGRSSFDFEVGSERLVASRCRQLQGAVRRFSSSAGDIQQPSSATDDGQGMSVLLRSLSGVVLAASAAACFWPSPAESYSRGDLTAQEDTGFFRRKEPRYIFGEAFRRRIFFNYEKRIRLRSSPEKVFEYFASYKNPEGELFMTPADLMRAIVPVFPPSESNIVREGFLRGERPPGELQCAASTFFMLFDTNNDGLISFAEYIFFVTLLSIPESSFSAAFKMFDLDNNGEIEREEFKKVMSLMRSYNRQGMKHRDGKRIGLKIGDSVENGGLVEYFFGKDGNSGLEHEKFVGFLRNLHDEIVRLEFAHYDYKLRGKISAKDFALSMVAAADMNLINRFLDRVEQIDDKPHIRNIWITLEEFKAFAELRRRIQPLALAIFSYGKVNGLLTKKDFQRAASQVCGVTITDDLVDVIFHIFDTNDDGSLSSEEFLAVLQRREQDVANPTGTGVFGMLACWLNCAKACHLPRVLMGSDAASY
ncbi:unnamed protein product [Victoria cruziana]